MNLTSKRFIKNLLKKYRVRPRERFGQNFLANKRVLKEIIKASDLSKKDIVLEIGPGIGNLTQELAKRVKKVITIEKDQKMIEILKETLRNFKNVEIIQADVLRFDLKSYKLKAKNYKLIANLPYYIVSPVIRKFLELTGVRPLQMVLMVQKEVAQRIVAKAPKMNLLAISVQFYAKPEIISYVSKKSFWPQPKVDGAIIKITPYSKRSAMAQLLPPRRRELFFRIVKAGFSHPRKQLINNLSKKLKIDRQKVKIWLLKSGIDPTKRAENLSIKNWIQLTKNFRI